MLNRFGVWIDKRAAVIVSFTESGEDCIHVASNVESSERRAGDRPEGAFEPLHVPADDTRDRKESAELGKFYDAVIFHLKDAHMIYICGPGEARKHLTNRIEEVGSITGKVVVEAADNMTDPQFIAKARKHFQL